MKFKEQELIQALEASFKAYKEYGARSTAKLKPLHKYLADILLDIWGNDFKVHYMGDVDAEDFSKEKKIKGKYNNKTIDVTITKDNTPVFCLGIKFVCSNYKQNSYNYFEGMMGETANIQRTDIHYAHIIVLPQKLPYFNKDGSVKKYEIIKDIDLQKYINLVFDIQNPHKPYAMGFFIIDINNDGTITKNDVNTSFSDIVAKLLKDRLSLESFFDSILEYKEHYISQK